MDLLADRYELAEVLGAGGMARVMAATDHRLRRRVAIKLVREELTTDPTSRERLLREARAAASLQHPNTVAVHDVGEHDGQAFIVMELVVGRTLADRLHAEGRLSHAEVMVIADAVLAGLEAAHQRGLVHRDVKPANVLLPDEGGVKLADFGIAKALDAATTGLTATGQVLGTPRYLAPEQVAGRQATPASDLYSLGAVLYECLAGRAPFEAETAIALALAHQRDPVPPLSRWAPGTPPAVARVIESALAKDPGQRPETAAGMRTALTAATSSSVTTAPLATADQQGPVADGVHDEPAVHPTTVLGGLAGTPSGDEGTSPDGVRRRRWVTLAAVGVAVAVGTLIALLADQDPGPPTGTPEPGAQVPDDPEDAEDTTDADDAADAEPADLDDLAARLARDPGGAGERGRDLLEELVELRELSGTERAEDARELITQVAGWLADGELDAEVGRQSVGLLEPVGRPEADGLAPVSELFAEVALDTRAWGEKGEDLLSGLEDLLGEAEAGARAEDAADLVEELEDWLEDGEIHAGRGRQAIRVLRAVPGA